MKNRDLVKALVAKADDHEGFAVESSSDQTKLIEIAVCAAYLRSALIVAGLLDAYESKE